MGRDLQRGHEARRGHSHWRLALGNGESVASTTTPAPKTVIHTAWLASCCCLGSARADDFKHGLARLSRRRTTTWPSPASTRPCEKTPTPPPPTFTGNGLNGPTTRPSPTTATSSGWRPTTLAGYIIERAYDLKREHDKAVNDTTEAIHLEPKNAVYHFDPRFAHYQKKAFDKAIDYADIRLDPKLAMAHGNLAWVLTTCPRDALHDGKWAVDLRRTRACTDRLERAANSTPSPPPAPRRAISRTPSSGRKSCCSRSGDTRVVTASGPATSSLSWSGRGSRARTPARRLAGSRRGWTERPRQSRGSEPPAESTGVTSHARRVNGPLAGGSRHSWSSAVARRDFPLPGSCGEVAESQDERPDRLRALRGRRREGPRPAPAGWRRWSTCWRCRGRVAVERRPRLAGVSPETQGASPRRPARPAEVTRRPHHGARGAVL